MRDSLGKQAQFLQAHKEVSPSVAHRTHKPGNQLYKSESREHPHKAPKQQEYPGKHPSLAWTWKILHCGPKQPVPVKCLATNLWAGSRVSETDVQLFHFPPQWTLSVKMLFKAHCGRCETWPCSRKVKHSYRLKSTRILAWMLIGNVYFKGFFSDKSN